jgi:hypothetical protein
MQINVAGVAPCVADAEGFRGNVASHGEAARIARGVRLGFAVNGLLAAVRFAFRSIDRIADTPSKLASFRDCRRFCFQGEGGIEELVPLSHRFRGEAEGGTTRKATCKVTHKVTR